jgi:hypothetical protein
VAVEVVEEVGLTVVEVDVVEVEVGLTEEVEVVAVVEVEVVFGEQANTRVLTINIKTRQTTTR